MDTKTLRMVSLEIEQVLAKHNLRVDGGLTLTHLGEGGKSHEEEEWNRYAPRLGLKAEWFGKTFQSPNSGGLFKITGIKPSRHKYPVSAIRVNSGRGFKFTVAQIQMAFGAMKVVG